MLFQIAMSPTLGEIVIFDNVLELQFTGGLSSLSYRGTLPHDQAYEPVEKHLVAAPAKALGGPAIAPVLNALGQRIVLNLDTGVLADQAPERIVDRHPAQQFGAFAGAVPQSL